MKDKKETKKDKKFYVFFEISQDKRHKTLIFFHLQSSSFQKKSIKKLLPVIINSVILVFDDLKE